MINGIFTRHRKIPFSSGSSGSTNVFTTVKLSLIVVGWTKGGGNNNVSVRALNYNSPLNSDLSFGESEDITIGETDRLYTYPNIVPSGTTINVSRSDCDLTIHVFELE